MAQTNISYNGNSLQTTSIVTADIDHLNLPAQYQPVYPLAHADSSSIPYQGYVSRVIKITGTLIGTSIANLDALVDTFKGYLSGIDQNLDIDYNGSTRRYVATVNGVSVDRPGGLAYATFEVDFICTNPFGINTSTTSLLSASGRTNASYTDSITVAGTAPYQLPVATITVSAITTSTTNLVSNPDFETNTTGYNNIIGTFTRVTTQHHSGVAAGQMVNAASSPTSGNYGWEYISMSGLTVGVTYTLSCWVKGNAGGENFTLGALGSGVAPTVVSLTTSFQQVFLTFTATSTFMELDFMSTTASATWFLDDVQLSPNVSSYMIFGNNGTGQSIGITRVWSIGDVVVVDCVAKTVTVNGVLVPYSGAFPEFPPGSQSLYYQDSFLTRTFNISVVYTQRFL